MPLHCNAGHDIACTIRDNLKTGQAPQCTGCAFLQKTFALKPCRCGTDCPPRIYEEGAAQRRVKYKDEKGPFEWVRVSRYTASCPVCGAATPLMETPDAAGVARNKHCKCICEVSRHENSK